MVVILSQLIRNMVLDYGRIIASGTPEMIKSNPEVIKAYLGTELPVAEEA